MNPPHQTPTMADEALRAAYISARIDRLPAVSTIWRLVALLSIAGFSSFTICSRPPTSVPA